MAGILSVSRNFLFGKKNARTIIDVASDNYEPSFGLAPTEPGSKREDMPKLESNALVDDAQDRAAFLRNVVKLQTLGDFDAAEAAFSTAEAGYANYPDYQISYAQTAQMRCDLVQALERSLMVLEQFPDVSFGYTSSVLLLLASAQVFRASDLLEKGQMKFGDLFEFSWPAIHLAIAKEDWESAGSLIVQYCDRHPDRQQAASEITPLQALVDQQRSRDVGIQARDRESRGDYPGALISWQTQAQTCGPTRDNMLGIGRCRRKLGDLEEAEESLRQAILAFPEDAETQASFAEVAAAANDWQTAAARWRKATDRFPEITAFGSPAAMAFARSGAIEEAEKLLSRMLAREPRSLDLLSTRALVAQFAGDWSAAVVRWRAVVEVAPTDETLRNLHGEAVWHRSLEGEEARSGLGQSEQLPDTDSANIKQCMDTTLREIIAQFESIGDNCEFGLVQRYFGAEPVSLFRFSALESSRLIELLDVGLEPLGDPEHTKIIEEAGEYVVKDDRGFYWMHSFLRINQVDPDRYLRQQSARIALLKRKFLSDLRSGYKIYVCKDSSSDISDDRLREISRSLQVYGKNLLLGIRRANDQHPKGRAEWLDDGVMIGYLSTLFCNDEKHIDYESWGSIVREAYSLKLVLEQQSKFKPVEFA